MESTTASPCDHDLVQIGIEISPSKVPVNNGTETASLEPHNKQANEKSRT